MTGAVLHPDMEAGIREAVRVATSPKTSEVRRRAMDAQGRVYKRRKSHAQVAQLPTSEAEPRATAAFLLGWQILMLIPLFFMPYALYMFKRRNAMLSVKVITLDYIDSYGPELMTGCIVVLTILTVSSSIAADYGYYLH